MPDISPAEAADRLRSIQATMRALETSSRTEAEKDHQHPILQEDVMGIVARLPQLVPPGFTAPPINGDPATMHHSWKHLAEIVSAIDPRVRHPGRVGTAKPIGNGEYQYKHHPSVTNLYRDMGVELVGWLIRRAEEVGKPIIKRVAKPKLSKEAIALATLVDHPEWTNQQVANAVGCHVKTLSSKQWRKFKAARGTLAYGRANMPSGSKDNETGDVEAWNKDDG